MMAAMSFKDEDHRLLQLQPLCAPTLRPEYLSQFDVTEFEVADILINLPYFISNSITDARFGSWGCKRRRSAERTSHSPRRKVLSPSSPPPSVNSAAKVEATSPATPLAFCPSDSDPPKSKQSTKSTSTTTKKTFLKRNRDEWQKIVEEKLQTQQTLLKEIEKVKLHLQTLNEENSELRAKKHKLIQGSGDVRRERAQLETECPQPQLELRLQYTPVNGNVLTGPSTSTLHQHQAPSIPRPIVNPTVHDPQPQPEGPREFDLNIAAEEMVQMEPAVALQPLDHHRLHQIMMNWTYADQARVNRQYRIQQNKSKKAQRGG